MKRKILFFFSVFFFLAGAAASQPYPLKLRDIPRVMDRFFLYHIENNELTPALVRRSIKLYLEQFDPEKVYLLESEVLPYFSLTDSKLEQIYQRLKKGDYRDFNELNRLVQKSILRAQKWRAELAQYLTYDGDLPETGGNTLSVRFARSEEELAKRQQSRVIRFFLFQKGRTHLETPERRSLVCQLFEKRARKFENLYLLLDAEGHLLPQERAEHLSSLRILKAFAKSLDTHTAFFSSEEANEMRLSLEKQFEGVGVILSEGIDGVVIAELIPGSPAAQSGKIRANDLLVEIDGRSTGNTSFEEILEQLKRREQNEVVLGLKRVDEQTQEEIFFRVPLKRQPIVMQEERIQTSFDQFGNGIIGKIALYSFYEGSDGMSSEKDIREAIRKFRQQGELLGLVLDLRENAGGFLSQAVKVAGLFISNGVVVISKYGKGEVHYLRNLVGKSFFNGPLVILTSKMSASASEIVAQALQDYGAAIIVGDERTFGKGSIQYQTVTDEKADLFFKVTVGKYYTVSGRSTQIEGVIADIVVPTQYAPYNIGERFLEYPLPADRVESAFADSLSDLDKKTRHFFQVRYLPYLQRVIPFWKRALPQLRKNSAYRIANNPDFQALLKKQERVRARQSDALVNTIDEHVESTLEDIQMKEGVNIVRDMILIEGESRQAQAAQLSTGTE